MNHLERRGYVTSRDGTRIHSGRIRHGEPIAIVHSGLRTADDWFEVAEMLAAAGFCSDVKDGRGRARSGDTDTYGMEREYEDICAAIEAARSSPHLIGHSFAALGPLGAA